MYPDDDLETSAEGASPSSRDYLFRIRGPYRDYFLTESGISEVKIRSKAVGAAISQLGIVGAAVNRSLNKSAMKGSRPMTLSDMREEGRVLKDVPWGKVWKVVLKGRKLKISGDGLHVKLKMAKSFTKTKAKVDSLVRIFSSYVGSNFVTNYEIPGDILKPAKSNTVTPLNGNGGFGNIKPGTPIESVETADKTSSQTGTGKSGSLSDQPLIPTPSGMNSDGAMENPSGEWKEPKKKLIPSGNKRKNTLYKVLALIVAIMVIIFLIHTLLPVSHVNGGGVVVYRNGTVTYSSNSTLSGNVYAGNVTIKPGVTVTTDGYNFFVSGSFINDGVIVTGHESLFANIVDSYGGSGGGGGYTYATGQDGSAGFGTRSPGGSGGEIGGNGVTPNPPSVSSSSLVAWNSTAASTGFPDGISEFLAGADGGYSGNGLSGSHPGLGAYGIVIEATFIHAGKIYANGTNTLGGGAGSGGGGGGVIILAYGNGGIEAGTYNVTGGSGQAAGVSYADNYGGNGGNGSVIAFDFGSVEPLRA